MIIVPAIDIIDNKVVRLTKGNYDSVKNYTLDPLEIAKELEDNNITHLHVVDLEGAKNNRIMNLKTLEKIANKTNLIVDFGGGVKTEQSLNDAFNAGAKRITCGSIAVKNPELVLTWLNKYGSDKLILGADCKKNKIATTGWLEVSELDVHEFINDYLGKGFNRVICTDISKDGMLKGPSFELYKSLIKNCNSNLELVASGGVSSISDIEKLFEYNLHSVIVGKAYLEGKISILELGKLQESVLC
ncbi:MAG: 1-(5-phosphoribosyl)-5-[(5-phosphoribosylamino)methylideneamino]imidazole-4-carboxamide isomerase [Pleomorphochaeta sp.]